MSKHKHMKKLLALAISGAMFLFVISTSCNKDDNNPADQSTTPTLTASLSGLGEHGGSPSGTPYVLPSNLRVIGSMCGGYPQGYSHFFTGTKDIKNIDNYQATSPKIDYINSGVGTYVYVYMLLYNTSFVSFDYVFPGGLILCDSTHGDTSSTDTTQSGLVVDEDTLHFPPDDTIGVCLRMFCLNAHDGVPSGNPYTFSVVTNNEQLYRMVAILKGKSSLEEHTGEIQSYIWQVTDGTGLTQADYDVMTTWP